MEKKKEEVWQIVYPHSAGIDVGSRFHMVAVGQSDDQVRKFGINTDDHNLMIDFLKVHQITHVAMESTGSYFQTLFLALQEAGFEVSLVHGSHTKGIGGQKTDVKDCKWIQKLFTYGFLKSCFLPSNATMEIRTLNRHRNNLIDESSRLLNRIGQCMRQMNIRLDVAINDLGGKTGQSIIQAIVEGQRDGNKLAILADSRIRKVIKN
ncbi:MAG: transposase [Saprospiraceae bacterium]|nr:transposase [Saprospiraceae bacterium]